MNCKFFLINMLTFSGKMSYSRKSAFWVFKADRLLGRHPRKEQEKMGLLREDAELFKSVDFIKPHRATFNERLPRGQCHDHRHTAVEACHGGGLVLEDGLNKRADLVEKLSV